MVAPGGWRGWSVSAASPDDLLGRGGVGMAGPGAHSPVETEEDLGWLVLQDDPPDPG